MNILLVQVSLFAKEKPKIKIQMIFVNSLDKDFFLFMSVNCEIREQPRNKSEAWNQLFNRVCRNCSDGKL